MTIESLRNIQSRLSPYLISFSSANISLNVTNSQNPPISDAAPVNPSFSFSPSFIPLVEFYPGELSKSITLSIVNDGNVARIPDIEIDPSGDLSLSFAVNRCNVSIEPRKNCSIQVKINNPPDSEIKTRDINIKINGVKTKFINIAAAKSKICQPNSQRSCSLSNATTAVQTCSSSGEEYGSCVATACMSGFILENGQCIPAQYTATYSSYSPDIPSSQAICDGTVISNRTIVECRRNYDNLLVANSLCSDSAATVNTQSPAGNKNVSIAFGSETYSCPLGSTTQTFVSRSCNSGYFNNGSSCQEIVVNYWGSGADGNLNTAGNTNLCDSTTDGEMCVRNYQNLTINSGHVLTTSVRRRGLLIYVQGDLVINGEISMTARGASGDPATFGVGTNGLSFYRFKSGGSQSGTSSIAGTGATAVAAEANQAAVTNGVLINIPRYGAVPQARITTNLTSTQGVNGVNGQTGSGSGGFLYYNGGTNNSAGPGGQGSCFTGGSGGGANFANTPNNLQCAAGANYGGAGGNACGDHPYGTGGGGAGNPVGTHTNRSTYTHVAPVSGTGGLLVIIVKGSVTIGSAGKITSQGSRGGYWFNPANGAQGYYGGGSGGGTIALIYAGTYNNGGSILTTGGSSSLDGTFKGGNGSQIIIQVDK